MPSSRSSSGSVLGSTRSASELARRRQPAEGGGRKAAPQGLPGSSAAPGVDSRSRSAKRSRSDGDLCAQVDVRPVRAASAPRGGRAGSELSAASPPQRGSAPAAPPAAASLASNRSSRAVPKRKASQARDPPLRAQRVEPVPLRLRPRAAQPGGRAAPSPRRARPVTASSPTLQAGDSPAIQEAGSSLRRSTSAPILGRREGPPRASAAGGAGRGREQACRGSFEPP